MRAILLVPAMLMAGCASTATRFWTIEPAAVSALPVVAATPAAPIRIAAVHLPLAIDRLEVVSHDEVDRVKVMDFDRWSAPPGDLMRRALTQDLIAVLPRGSVVYPEAPVPAATRNIVVDVLDLRRDGDRYVMQASWSLAEPAGASHQLQLEATAGAGDVAAQVDKLAAMMAQLAGSIAATQLPPAILPAPPPGRPRR